MIIEREYDPGTPASVAIVDELSALEGADVTPDEVWFVLYEHVDPEALDRIMSDGAGAGDVVVSISIEEYRVTVSNAGRIQIRARE
ncbi:HalOD1 output domain-containing protein [Natronorubrum sp. DTA7]|uniref:HalOD1 output domain-containing protein n=1 Tax=Natronorubrum sp. DTA7 TaxID=3447016 RepID=UPI003F826759